MPDPIPGRFASNPQVRFGITYFALFAAVGAVAPYYQKLLYLQGSHEKQIGFILATGGGVRRAERREAERSPAKGTVRH